MTLEEFNVQFDIQYDSIAGKSAPNIDLFEKSVYLTKAQLEFIKNRYSPLSNSKGIGFEGSSKRRVDLKELIKDFKSDSFIKGLDNISNDSYFINIPDDTFIIIQEQVINTNNGCNTQISVTPMTYDEYNVQIKNPFRKPNNRRVWRLDYSSRNNNNTIELVTSINPIHLEYSNRYIKYPNPIILINLNEEFPNENLTISGKFLKSECELDISTHDEILNRAVELAVGDYKPQALNQKLQLDSREE